MILNFCTTDPNLYPAFVIKKQDICCSHQHAINEPSPYRILFEKLRRHFLPKIFPTYYEIRNILTDLHSNITKIIRVYPFN